MWSGSFAILPRRHAFDWGNRARSFNVSIAEWFFKELQKAYWLEIHSRFDEATSYLVWVKRNQCYRKGSDFLIQDI
jgi:hypothetical protein